jgi:hypothetical protein
MPPHVRSAAIHLPAAGPCNPPARLQTVPKCVTPSHHVLSHQYTAVPTFGTAKENENQASGAHWRQRIVSVVYPVNVAEAALGKQAGGGLLDWGNAGEIYKKAIWKGPD